MSADSRIPNEVQTAARGLLAPYGVDLDRLLGQSDEKPQPPQLCTLSDTAALLRCSKRNVHRLIANGTLPVLHLGKRASRVPEEAIRQLIERSC